MHEWITKQTEERTSDSGNKQKNAWGHRRIRLLSLSYPHLRLFVCQHSGIHTQTNPHARMLILMHLIHRLMIAPHSHIQRLIIVPHSHIERLSRRLNHSLLLARVESSKCSIRFQNQVAFPKDNKNKIWISNQEGRKEEKNKECRIKLLNN